LIDCWIQKSNLNVTFKENIYVRGAFPAPRRALLIRETIPAKTGVLALVPES
jgi:hypothetical protein